MCKAIADFIVAKGYDRNDDDVNLIRENLELALKNAFSPLVDDHNSNADAHETGISGNAATSTKLKTGRTIQIDLTSTSAATFNGTANITPGVTGVLPVANGGTGSALEKYVQLTGDTMTGTLQMKASTDKASTAPSTEYQKDIFNFVGSDGNRYGFMRLNHKTDGSHTLSITNVKANNSPDTGIMFVTDTSGNLTSINGKTPSTDAKEIEITTANWVRTFSNALKALIGVTPAADKIPYFTGESAAALTTLSSFARTILDDTSDSAVRSTIGANAQNCGGIVAANLAANGYAKWANGLIIQWGNINVDTTDTKVTLPISFSNNAYRVIVTSTWNTEAIGSTLTKEFHNTGGKTTSTFYIKSNYSNAMDWIAIGY